MPLLHLLPRLRPIPPAASTVAITVATITVMAAALALAAISIAAVVQATVAIPTASATLCTRTTVLPFAVGVAALVVLTERVVIVPERWSHPAPRQG